MCVQAFHERGLRRPAQIDAADGEKQQRHGGRADDLLADIAGDEVTVQFARGAEERLAARRAEQLRRIGIHIAPLDALSRRTRGHTLGGQRERRRAACGRRGSSARAPSRGAAGFCSTTRASKSTGDNGAASRGVAVTIPGLIAATSSAFERQHRAGDTDHRQYDAAHETQQPVNLEQRILEQLVVPLPVRRLPSAAAGCGRRSSATATRCAAAPWFNRWIAMSRSNNRRRSASSRTLPRSGAMMVVILILSQDLNESCFVFLDELHSSRFAGPLVACCAAFHRFGAARRHEPSPS